MIRSGVGILFFSFVFICSTGAFGQTDGPQAESPIVTLETPWTKMLGPDGSEIEVRGEFTVIQIPYGDKEKIDAARAWVAENLKEVRRNHPNVKQDIVLVNEVPENERLRFAASEEAYRMSLALSGDRYNGHDTLGLERLGELREKDPSKLKRWEDGIRMAESVAGEGTPFYIGMVPRNPGAQRLKEFSFVILRFFLVGGAVYQSVRMGDSAVMEKALVVGGVCGALSATLMLKFREINNYLGSKGFFKLHRVEESPLWQSTTKFWGVSVLWYSMAMFSRWLTGLSATFSGPFTTSTQSLVTEMPPAIALSRIILKKIQTRPDRQKLIWTTGMVAQVALSAIVTGLIMSDMGERAGGEGGWSVSKISLYTIGLVGGVLVVKPKLKVWKEKVVSFFSSRSGEDVPVEVETAIGLYSAQIKKPAAALFGCRGLLSGI